MPHFKQGSTALDIVSDKLKRPAFGARSGGTFFRDVASGPVIFDDFLGDVLADEWGSTKGSDGATVAAAIAVLPSGVARLVTGAGADTVAANGVVMVSELQWKLNAGNTIFEARVKASAVTALRLFVGFTDTLALEAPMTLSVVTFTANADDAVGFIFDTDATTDTIRCHGVAATVKNTAPINTAVVPVLAVYNKFRIQIDAAGTAEFFIDDISYGSLAVASTITVAMTPVIFAQSHTGAAINVDVDYIYVSQDRV